MPTDSATKGHSPAAPPVGYQPCGPRCPKFPVRQVSGTPVKEDRLTKAVMNLKPWQSWSSLLPSHVLQSPAGPASGSLGSGTVHCPGDGVGHSSAEASGSTLSGCFFSRSSGQRQGAPQPHSRWLLLFAICQRMKVSQNCPEPCLIQGSGLRSGPPGAVSCLQSVCRRSAHSFTGGPDSCPLHGPSPAAEGPGSLSSQPQWEDGPWSPDKPKPRQRFLFLSLKTHKMPLSLPSSLVTA